MTHGLPVSLFYYCCSLLIFTFLPYTIHIQFIYSFFVLFSLDYKVVYNKRIILFSLSLFSAVVFFSIIYEMALKLYFNTIYISSNDICVIFNISFFYCCCLNQFFEYYATLSISSKQR